MAVARMRSNIQIPRPRLIEDRYGLDALLQQVKKEMKAFAAELDRDAASILAFVKGIVEQADQYLRVLRSRHDIHEDQETERLFSRLISDQLRLLVESREFCTVYPRWRETRIKTIARLNDIANDLDQLQSGVNISKMSGNIGGLASGGLGIAGIILAPVSGGASLGLAAASITLGSVSAVTGIGAQIGLNVSERRKLDKVKEAINEDSEHTRRIFRALENADALIQNSERICNQLHLRINKMKSDIPGWKFLPISMSTVALTTLKSTKLFGRLAARLDDGLTTGVGSATAKATSKAGYVLIGIGMAVDFVDLMYTVHDMSTGSKSELAEKLRHDIISVLEAEQESMDEVQRGMAQEQEIMSRFGSV